MSNIYSRDIMMSYKELLSGGLLVQEYYGASSNPLPNIDELTDPEKFHIIKAGMYPPEGMYAFDNVDFSVVAVTMLIPKGNVPRLRNVMETGIIYSVCKNGKMIYDTSTGSRPPSGIYGPGQGMEFTFSQTYGQVCFNTFSPRAVDVSIRNIVADGEWCLKFYSHPDPDGDTEPIATKYVLAQSGTSGFKLGNDDNKGIPFSAIGIMSNGCTRLKFDEIYMTPWETGGFDGKPVPPKYYPLQPYMKYATKWFSDYSLKEKADTISNTDNDLPINVITYIIRNTRFDRKWDSYQKIPLNLFLS